MHLKALRASANYKLSELWGECKKEKNRNSLKQHGNNNDLHPLCSLKGARFTVVSNFTDHSLNKWKGRNVSIRFRSKENKKKVRRRRIRGKRRRRGIVCLKKLISKKRSKNKRRIKWWEFLRFTPAQLVLNQLLQGTTKEWPRSKKQNYGKTNAISTEHIRCRRKGRKKRMFGRNVISLTSKWAHEACSWRQVAEDDSMRSPVASAHLRKLSRGA